MGKSLNSDSASARPQKQQKEASRRAAPDARERIPTGASGASSVLSFLRCIPQFSSNNVSTGSTP
jgi:hypothetical protein